MKLSEYRPFVLYRDKTRGDDVPNFTSNPFPDDPVHPLLGTLSRNYGLQERQFPPFGPFGKSGPIFPSTLTGKFIKNHIKRRSQTSAVLFGVASILGVSPNSLWRHVCGEDRQPNILQCDPALLLAIHTRLVQEHPEAMERIDTYMRDQRNLGLDALIQQGDTLVCFWVLFNLQNPKATGPPFRLDISHEMRVFKRLYQILSNQLCENLD